MVRKVDYDSRKRTVLAATINKYIQEAYPVASEDISTEFDLSSATIRSIFAELEKSGYLTHPYTSGGRMPTSKGYRYYVDFLLAQTAILEEEKEHIRQEYQMQMHKLEDLLDRTSELIASITHYTGIASVVDWQDKFFYRGIGFVLDQPEFKDLSRVRFLIWMIEDKQRLLNIINRDFSEKVKVYIGEELSCPEMGDCSLVVCRYRIKDKPSGRLAVLGPTRMEYRHIIPALEYISEVLTDAVSEI